ncbi:carboxypeptidase-like regulatory domain-containing protein [Lacibacter sp. H375]|uniref:carboxypeptidase-like regulatory domain-containing protein n=1 Tax=Lacibacter sp. H375 TaxID=3133424 RepID=UPI0030C0F535
MKYHLCYLLICLFANVKVVHAFERIQGVCIDAESRRGVPFATVVLQKTNLFTDADSSGFFEIDIFGDDTLLVTSIGYKDHKIAISDLKKEQTVFLQPLPVQLSEVFVGKRQSMTIGLTKGKKKFTMNSDDCLRFEMATRINIPDNVGQFQLKSVSINGVGFNEENPVRIHIYNVGKYGEPAFELLKKDIVITKNSSKNNVLHIDVEGQGIFLSDDQFFVGVQWIADSINKERINTKKERVIGPGVYCSHYISSTVTYTRSSNLAGYKWMLHTNGIIYPFDYDKIPSKIKSPLNMLVSCDILY